MTSSAQGHQKGSRRNLAALQQMAWDPDDYIKLMLNQPRFSAEEVLSQTSTADAFVTAAGNVDEDTAAFKSFEQKAWDTEMKAMAPRILQQAKTDSKPDVKLGAEAGKAKRESRRKRDSMQCH